MGWDDNGLPTERRVENYYGVRCDPSLPYDPGFEPPGEAGPKTSGAGLRCISRRNFIELCERLTAERREGVRGAVAPASACRSTGRMTYTTIDARSQRVSPARRSCATSARGEAYPAEAPSPVGRRLPDCAVAQAELEDRERPGAYHRIALPPHRRRRAGLHRDHPARAARRAASPSSPTPTTSATSRCSAPPSPRRLRRRGPGPGPPAGRARQGHRHRHDLHLRRHHRRHLVARAAARRPASIVGKRRPHPPDTPEWTRHRPDAAPRTPTPRIAGKTVKQAPASVMVELLTRDRRPATASPSRSPTR